MGSKAGDVWKFLVPVLPSCGRSRNKYPACLLRSTKAPDTAAVNLNPTTSTTTLQQLREEISAVGARVSYVEEQMEHIKAALPDLDSKIRYASLGMPLSSLSLEEMLHLKGIHFKLLRFWEELSRKQLEKLGALSDRLQALEEQRGANATSQGGGEEPPSGNYGSEEELCKEFEQQRVSVSKKVESDLRRNQELQMKLYLDRISSVSDLSKLAQIPPERGPQGFASEQMGAVKKPRVGEPKLQSEIITMEQLVINKKKVPGATTPPPTPPPSTPSSGIAAAASSTAGSLARLATSVPRYKEPAGAASAPATPLLQPVQVPSSIQV